MRLMGFETLLPISLVVETLFFKHMFNRTTHPPCTLCENWQSFLGGKYFIFRKPIKLTSPVGVKLMGQYKHTNINLTTEMGSHL